MPYGQEEGKRSLSKLIKTAPQKSLGPEEQGFIPNSSRVLGSVSRTQERGHTRGKEPTAGVCEHSPCKSLCSLFNKYLHNAKAP